VLHDEHGVAEARGDRKRTDISRLLQDDGVYILVIPVSGD
jgi:hypothetical protein